MLPTPRSARRPTIALAISCALAFAACTTTPASPSGASSATPVDAAPPPASAPSPSPRPSYPWVAELNGRCIDVRGIKERRGSTRGLVQSGNFAIEIAWESPELARAFNDVSPGFQVHVRGIVSDGSDMPDVVPGPGEPPPVLVDGTDARGRPRRAIVKATAFIALRSSADFQRELEDGRGKDRDLEGVIEGDGERSWLDYDGVRIEIHTAADAGSPPWDALRGTVQTLHGQVWPRRQSRRDPRPKYRIDVHSFSPRAETCRAIGE